jgi:hypothetical protein
MATQDAKDVHHCLARPMNCIELEDLEEMIFASHAFRGGGESAVNFQFNGSNRSFSRILTGDEGCI